MIILSFLEITWTWDYQLKICFYLCCRTHIFSLWFLTTGAQNRPAERGVKERKRDCRENSCSGVHTEVFSWPPTSSLYLTEEPRLLLWPCGERSVLHYYEFTQTRLPLFDTWGHRCIVLHIVTFPIHKFCHVVTSHSWMFVCMNVLTLISHMWFWFPDIETNFLPWLMSEVNNSLEKRFTARELLDSKIFNIYIYIYLFKMTCKF